MHCVSRRRHRYGQRPVGEVVPGPKMLARLQEALSQEPVHVEGPMVFNPVGTE